MNWYLDVLKKYAVFSGRARRKEYWMFFLFNVIAAFVIGFIAGVLGLANDGGGNILSSLYSLAVLLPSLGVAIRRMHDTNHSGWWLLVPIVNLVFTLTEGTKGDNKYGSDPKAEEVVSL